MISKNIATAAIGASVIGISALYFAWKKMKSKRLQFVKIGKLQKLLLYPVKSLPGIELESAECSKEGLRIGSFRDRAWVVLRDGKYINLKTDPKLALLKASIHGEQLHIDGPGLPTLKLPTKYGQEYIKANSKTCNILGSDVEVVDCGEAARLFFEQFFNESNITLVYCDESLRKRKPLLREGKTLKVKPGHPILGQDESGYHLVCQASVDDLNSRLPPGSRATDHQNFRPNFLVENATAYEEDSWEAIRIADTVFAAQKPCDRCVKIIVNPDTGENNDQGPLKILRSYRMAPTAEERKIYAGSPLFGTMLYLQSGSSVSLGDDVFAAVRE